MRNDIPNMAEEFEAMPEQFMEELQVAALLIGEKVERHFAQNITQGGYPTFKPLSDSRIRQRHGSEDPILIWEGTGVESVANSAQSPITNGTTITIEFEAEDYMKYHNEGEGNNPKREFTGTEEEVDEIINEEVEERLNVLRNFNAL